MNINNKFVTSDVISEILNHTDCPLSLRLVCKSFATSLPTLFWERCQTHRSLKERAHMIEEDHATLSSQQKIQLFCAGLKEGIAINEMSFFLPGGNIERSPLKVSIGPLSLERLIKLENAIEDKSLYILFTKIIEQIPDDQPSIEDIRKCQHESIFGNEETIATVEYSEKARHPIIFLDRTIFSYPTHVTNISEKIKNIHNKAANKIRAWLLSNQDKLAGIKTLDLKGKKLEKLAKEIGLFNQLENLCLGREIIQYDGYPPLIMKNKLINLTTEIGKLNKLKILDLSDNNLTRLPTAISELTQLETLILDNNKQLSKLPPKISQLPLKLISIQGNTHLLDCLDVFFELAKKGLRLEI